jgi:cleavage and polyadenylation specificity factor subunit 1
MSLFAKDLDYLDVLAADFLPDGRKLYVVVADGDCNLHVLQYDPEGASIPLPTQHLSRQH